MLIRIAILGALLLCAPFVARVDANAARCCAPAVLSTGALSTAASPLDAIRERLGTWVALDAEGKPTSTIVSIFKETAGGTAIVETLFPGAPEEMMSIYSVDDGKLVLQHYCIMGNQPRYTGEMSKDGKTLSFRCDGGGNLKDHDRAHMHEGTMVFVDDDRMDTRWTATAAGEIVEDVKFQVARKRDAAK